MARGFELQLVLDLALRDAEDKAREVKRSHGEWLRARGQRVHLLALRDERVNALATQFQSGLSADTLSMRASFLQMQQIELRKAAQRIDETYQVWQKLLQGWMHAQDHVKALRVLEVRYLERRAVQLRRLEQRQHDELAQNTRFWRNDSETVM